MSIAFQTQLAELSERFDKFEKIVKDGIDTESNKLIQTLQQDLTDLKAKYHMLNARLKKYNVD